MLFGNLLDCMFAMMRVCSAMMNIVRFTDVISIVSENSVRVSTLLAFGTKLRILVAF